MRQRTERVVAWCNLYNRIWTGPAKTQIKYERILNDLIDLARMSLSHDEYRAFIEDTAKEDTTPLDEVFTIVYTLYEGDKEAQKSIQEVWFKLV